MSWQTNDGVTTYTSNFCKGQEVYTVTHRIDFLGDFQVVITPEIVKSVKFGGGCTVIHLSITGDIQEHLVYKPERLKKELLKLIEAEYKQYQETKKGNEENE